MSDAMHFERQAASYAGARPPYPEELYDHLGRSGVVGVGTRVLEIGAGTGQATRELVRRGCRVVALEPGPDLARLLHDAVPQATVVTARAEDLDSSAAEYDAVVAATSMHWVDLGIVLPLLHRALRPGGRLAVWRTVYGDLRVPTPFRDDVARIVARREDRVNRSEVPQEPRPTPAELEAGGWFTHDETWGHAWSVDLTPDQIGRLFQSFSDWSEAEAAEARAAAERHGPLVREHYVTQLHLLTRRP